MKLLLLTIFFSLNNAIPIIFDSHSHSPPPGSEFAIDDTFGPMWSIQENIEWHVHNNYNAMAITNHWDLISPDLIQLVQTSNIVVLPGIEADHVVFIFDPSKYTQEFVKNYTAQYLHHSCNSDLRCLKKKYDYVHSVSGAIISLAHPAYSHSLSTEIYQMLGVDYIEKYTTFLQTYWGDYPFLMTGSDAHNELTAWPCGTTRFEAVSLSPQDIFDALKFGPSPRVSYDWSCLIKNWYSRCIVAFICVVLFLSVVMMSVMLWYFCCY